MTEAAVKGALVIMARDLRGMTQAELSDASGVPQTTISRIENDVEVAGVEIANRFAVPLSLHPEFFSLPYDVQDPREGRAFHRTRTSVLQRDRKLAVAEANLVSFQLRRVRELFDWSSFSSLPELDQDDVGIGPEAAARRVRAVMKLGNDPVPCMARVLEQAGALVCKRPWATLRMDACCLRVDQSHSVVLVNSRLPHDRLRFTLAHELGHLVLHRELEQTTARIESREVEEEADVFASEFLMPTQGIKPDIEGRVSLDLLASLKQKWRVSIQSLLFKARQLGLVSEYRYRQLMKEISWRGWRRNEPIRVVEAEPTLYRQIWELLRADGAIDQGHIESLALVKPEELDLLVGENSQIRFLG